MAYALGSAIAPVLGGRLTDKYGFRVTSDVMSLLTLVCAVLFFLVVLVPAKFCNKPLKHRSSSIV